MSIQQSSIYFGPSELHGKGVFAAQDFEPGDVIEICPVIVFPRAELHHMRQTVLDDYYFDWGDDGAFYAVCLGFGSLYNHSYTPNAEYDMDFGGETIDVYCVQSIKAGEEILFNYNGYPEDQTPVWFEKGENRSAKQDLPEQ